jgi:hypothetical protein
MREGIRPVCATGITAATPAQFNSIVAASEKGAVIRIAVLRRILDSPPDSPCLPSHEIVDGRAGFSRYSVLPGGANSILPLIPAMSSLKLPSITALALTDWLMGSTRAPRRWMRAG